MLIWSWKIFPLLILLWKWIANESEKQINKSEIKWKFVAFGENSNNGKFNNEKFQNFIDQLNIFNCWI